jgi:uncharacterized protein (DUF58 family)
LDKSGFPNLSPFDPQWETRLGGLVFHPRGPAEGTILGQHASVRRGRAGEFVDRRTYSPGDDHRRIDWNVYARSDRWTVREEREDTTLRVTLLLDVSRSMAFSADGRIQKRRYAAGLLAGLGFVLHRGRDAMGWGFFEHTLLSFQSPRSGPEVLARLFHQLNDPPQGRIAHFQDSFQAFLTQTPGRGTVVVVSDFLGNLDDILTGFRWLRTRHGDVSALQVLDPVELDLSFRGVRRFEDMESADVLRADPDVLARSYKNKMDHRQKALVKGLNSLSVPHALFRTDRPVEEELVAFLHQRGSRR